MVVRAAVASAAEIENEVAKLAAPLAGGLIVAPDTFTAYRQTILASAAQHGVPAIHPYRQSVVEGGLMSYAPDTLDIFRRSATYVDRILKGEKPGDLPARRRRIEFGDSCHSTNLLGCSTGMSAGFSPCRILITKSALRRSASNSAKLYDIRPPTSVNDRGTVRSGQTVFKSKLGDDFGR